MKYFILTSVFISQFSLSTPSSKEQKEQQVKVDLEQELLKDPEVKGVYDSCESSFNPDTKKYEFNGSNTSEMSDCIFSNLDEAKRQEVTDKYFNVNEKEPAIALDYTPGSQQFKRQSDEALDKLQAHLNDSLRKEIFGKDATVGLQKNKKLVDSGIYNTMYRTQLTKNIFSTYSSYCFFINDTQKAIGNPSYSDLTISKDPDKRAKAMRANQKLLADKTPSKITDIKTGQVTERPKSSSLWINCIAKLPQICNKISSTTTDVDQKYSKQQACAVVDEVRRLKHTIAANEEMIKINDRLRGSEGINYGDIDIDRATTVTSKEIDENFSEGNTARFEELNELCEQSPESEECSSFFADAESIKKEQNRITQYELQNELAKEKFNKLYDADKEAAVRMALKDELRDDPEIEEILKQAGDDFEKVKDAINKKFDEERSAIAESFKERLKQLSKTENNPDADKKKLEQITKTMAARSDEFKSLVHFTNIVAGYLEISGEEGADPTKNTKSINFELEYLR